VKRWGPFVASLALLGGLFWSLREEPAAPIIAYCAAGIRPPVEAAAARYDRKVLLQFGGSQTLVANAAVSGRGDLLIAADEATVEQARAKGLIEEVIPLARVKPVLAVRKGNPLRIASLEPPKARVALPHPEATSSGRLAKRALGKDWDALVANGAVLKPTVNEVANDLKLGSADAGIVWDATVGQYPELEAIPLPALAPLVSTVSAVVLKSATSSASALRFARFLAAPDQGGPEFAKAGYGPAGGDAWAASPVLLVYAGAMLRPAIEPTLEAFERREGCTVRRVYNGCGILVAGMKTGEQPDLYFACDPSFMDEVKERFGPPTDVSINQLVILVRKGNPHGVRTLKDLGKPGLRVGVGHEKQCALGALTQETLKQGKVLADVMKNVVVQSPTGDLLVNQMRAGSLDAVIAYVSNAASAPDELDAIPVDLPCALAVQPVATSRETRHAALAARLVEALRSPASRERFVREGFRWKGP
jgi:ABC-type molybdate transport system substrate-binding protein